MWYVGKNTINLMFSSKMANIGHLSCQFYKNKGVDNGN